MRRPKGHIRQRGKNSWQIKHDLPSEGGQRRTRFETFHGTKADAEKRLRELLHMADKGTLPEPDQQTVAEYLTAWLDSTCEQSPKTLERYRELADLKIIPHLGNIKLQKLKPEHIPAWHRKLLDEGTNPPSIGHAHRVLTKVLGVATKNGTVTRNVAAVHAPPRVERRKIEILSPDQVAAVKRKLKGHPLFPIVYLALATGMRRGELLALQWGDVDLERGTLRVERAVEETKTGLRLKPPKTEQGRRTITLPAEAVGVLRDHKVPQMELRLKIGMGPIKDDTLLFSTTDGHLVRPRNITKAWHRVRQAMRLPNVSFHSFRHTHASHLLRLGIDVQTVSSRLGHRDATITLKIYSHLTEGADAAAAKAIEGLLS